MTSQSITESFVYRKEVLCGISKLQTFLDDCQSLAYFRCSRQGSIPVRRALRKNTDDGTDGPRRDIGFNGHEVDLQAYQRTA